MHINEVVISITLINKTKKQCGVGSCMPFSFCSLFINLIQVTFPLICVIDYVSNVTDLIKMASVL